MLYKTYVYISLFIRYARLLTKYPHVEVIFDVALVIFCTTVVMITDGIPDLLEPVKVSCHLRELLRSLGSSLFIAYRRVMRTSLASPTGAYSSSNYLYHTCNIQAYKYSSTCHERTPSGPGKRVRT